MFCSLGGPKGPPFLFNSQFFSPLFPLSQAPVRTRPFHQLRHRFSRPPHQGQSYTFDNWQKTTFLILPPLFPPYPSRLHLAPASAFHPVARLGGHGPHGLHTRANDRKPELLIGSAGLGRTQRTGEGIDVGIASLKISYRPPWEGVAQSFVRPSGRCKRVDSSVAYAI